MGNSYYNAYIGTNSVRGSRGIYTLRIDADTGASEIVSTRQAYNAGCVVLSGDEKNLYAVTEGMTFDGFADGGLTAYAVQPDGSLKKRNGQRSHGQRTCCAAVDSTGKNAYACNFYHGTWSAFPLAEDGSLAPARLVIEPPEDAAWKALHCIGTIDDAFVGVISLAECALVVYRASDGTRVTSFPFPNHPFPRYFTVAGNTIYAMMQFPDEIYVLENRLETEGTLKLLQTISLMDDAHRAMPATSTIRVTPDHSLVLAANRPSNTITIYARQPDGTLVRENVADIPGNGPRDFNISRDGALVVTAMQHSNEVFVLRLDAENKTLVQLGNATSVPSPAAVAVSGRVCK